MKLTMRAKMLGKKVTLISTAFVLAVSTLTAVVPFVASQKANAAPNGTIIVTDTVNKWGTGEQTRGGTSTFVADAGAPYGVGGLLLTTPADVNAKAQRTVSLSSPVKLSDVTNLSYWTKYVSGASHAAVSLQLTVDSLSTAVKKTTLVYEPYYNGSVDTSGQWQNWNLRSGKFWVTATAGGMTKTSGGPADYSFDYVKSNNPDARITGLKVNVGTYNVNYNVLVDGVTLNSTVYDFEPNLPTAPTDLGFTDAAQACGGYTNVNFTQPTWAAVNGAVKYNYEALYNGSTIFSTTYTTNQHPGGTFGGGENGQWGYQVQSVDANGLTSAWSPVCTITLDTAKPAIEYVTPISDGQVLTPLNSIEVKFSDGIELDKTTVHVYKDGTTAVPSLWVHPYVNGTTHTVTLPLAGVADGTYQIRAAATDQAGNREQVNRTFKVDGSGPTITVQPTSIGSNGSYSKLGFNFFDENMVDYVVINGQKTELGNNKWSNLNDIAANNWYNVQEGANTLVAYDVLGNKTSVDFVIDRIAPIIVGFNYSNNNGSALTNNDVTVTMVTNERIAVPDGWTREDNTHYTKNVAANGKQSIAVKDEAGNSSVTKTFEVKRIDRNAPEIRGIANGATVRGSVNLSIFDPKYEGYDGFDKNHGLKVNGVDVATVDGLNKTYLHTVSGDGKYTVTATDKAKNETTIEFTINNGITYDVNDIETDSLTPAISGIVTYIADKAPVSGLNLVVDVDGTEYPTATNSEGRWTVGVIVANGLHNVKVSLVNDDATKTQVLATTFNTEVEAVDNGGNGGSAGGTDGGNTGGNDGGAPDNGANTNNGPAVPGSPRTIFGTPAFINPGAQAVLGQADTTIPQSSEGAPEVKGTSTLDNLAQAVDANNTDGKAMGLAWYWWLLIAAGAALALWWIIAAVRRRGEA